MSARTAILCDVWAFDFEPASSTLDVYVMYLRGTGPRWRARPDAADRSPLNTHDAGGAITEKDTALALTIAVLADDHDATEAGTG
jgi:DNA-binding response OmpR family regulator